MMKNNIISFNNIIEKLNKFWLNVGCIILQPTDFEVGAATFHPATFINAVTSDYFRAAYVQLSRRPFDLRYSSFSNKNSIFHQYQVIIKPSINNIKNIYLESLKNIGINIFQKNMHLLVCTRWIVPQTKKTLLRLLWSTFFPNILEGTPKNLRPSLDKPVREWLSF